MSPGRLLALFALALIITVAIAASTQAPKPPHPTALAARIVSANEAIIDMVAAKLSEVIIAKIQTSKTNFNLRTPALVELNSSAAIRGS